MMIDSHKGNSFSCDKVNLFLYRGLYIFYVATIIGELKIKVHPMPSLLTIIMMSCIFHADVTPRS